MKKSFLKAIFLMMLLNLVEGRSVEHEMVTLLVTGSNSGNDRIEIIKPNGDVKTCPQSSNYPLKVRDAAGGYSNNEGSVSICGGLDGSYRSECYTLEKSKWEPAGNLKNARNSHGASYITTGLWMTGGWNGLQRLASTELLLPDGKVTSGPNLPEARSGHCQVSYQDTTFIIGGYTNQKTNTVLQYKTGNINETPIQVASMVHARRDHACTIFNSPAHNGRPVAIVAGGGRSSNTAEILDFTQEGSSWQEIANLPTSMEFGPRMSPTADGDNVLLTYKHGIYTLSRSGSSYQWIKKPQELSIQRERHLQFTVPSSLISC